MEIIEQSSVGPNPFCVQIFDGEFIASAQDYNVLLNFLSAAQVL